MLRLSNITGILMACGLMGAAAAQADESEVVFNLLPGSDGAYTLLQYNDYQCFVYPHYLVGAQSEPDEVGENIFVRIRNTEQNEYQDADIGACDEIIRQHDFQFPNNDNAPYFFGLYKDLLFIDMGTGTGRAWSIRDLTRDKEVLQSDYAEPSIDAQGTLSFWVATRTPATRENCPEFDDYGADPDFITIRKKVTIDLGTLERTDTAEMRCSYHE